MPAAALRLALAFSSLLTVAACDDAGDGQRGAVPGAGRGGPGGFSRGPTLVVAEAATVRPIREQIEAIGTTQANESVIITAKVTDTVSRVNFEDGDFVAAGDVLVELTNEEQRALLAEAEANRDDATTQFRRLENLLTQQSIPESDVDVARARMAAETARYQSVVARLDDRLIRAPFSGLLGFREVSTGTLVTPGTKITSLDDISVIKLDFLIPEVYLSLVAPGMHLNAESPAFPGVEFDATVRTVGSRVDPVTRAATVRAHISNEQRRLLPGMLLTVRLTTAEREALMIPEAAMIQRAAQSYVYTIRDDRAEMLQIQSGTRYGGWVEVLDGLSEGTEVIAEGVIKIRNGSPVTTDATAERQPGAGRADVPRAAGR